MSNKAYINALFEEGTRDDLIRWIKKLDEENDKLRDEVKKLSQGHHTNYVM
jgi:hypothetical protein